MNIDSPPEENGPADGPSVNATTHGERYSYLLRLWRGGAGGGWCASLHSVQTGERHMFADVESLLAFLLEQASTPQR